ncbi:MAG: cell division protein FtsQ [Saprospiraceae bacterium]
MNKRELNRLLKRLFWIALFFVAIGFIFWAAEKKRSTITAEVVITIKDLPDGSSLLNKQDVRLKIERHFGYHLEGVPLGQLDVERVERVLEEDPFILDANVFVDAKSRANIEVSQRMPILRLIDKNTQHYYLDKSGRQMPLSEHFTARVLVATGNIPPYTPEFDQRKRHVLKDLFALTKDILADDFMRPLVEQIYIDEEGEFILIPKIGKHKIVVGDYENAAAKIENLKHFYKEGIPYEGWRKYKIINLKYKDQIVCTKA